MLHKKFNSIKVLHIYFFICITSISIELCSSETITLHGPNNTTYTYDNSSHIGHGTRGVVYKGKNQNGEKVAIKIQRDACYNGDFMHEVHGYRILNNTGVVPKLYAHFNNTEGLSVLVMELQGESVQSFIKHNPNGIRPNFVSKVANEFINVLETVHKAGVVHGEQTLLKYLIDRKGSTKLYLIDFNFFIRNPPLFYYYHDIRTTILNLRKSIEYNKAIDRESVKRLDKIKVYLKKWTPDELRSMKGMPDYNYLREILASDLYIKD